jgi:2-hydroxymuconate-semialdehyde hydrolase
LFPASRQRWVDALASDEAKLRALTHDTLILHGREDRMIALESSQKLLDLLPNAQLHVFGRYGH